MRSRSPRPYSSQCYQTSVIVIVGNSSLGIRPGSDQPFVDSCVCSAAFSALCYVWNKIFRSVTFTSVCSWKDKEEMKVLD